MKNVQSPSGGRAPRAQGERVALLLYLAVVGVVAFGMIRLVAWEDGRRPSGQGIALGSGSPDSGPAACTRCIGGTGTALPVLERLAGEFEAGGGVPVRLAASIGSTGGLAALRDGLLDCAVLSRPLRQGEAEGFRVLPFAGAPVALVGSEALPPRGLTLNGLLALYAGEIRTWSDGEPVTVLLREPGDSATRLVADAVPGFGQVHERALASGAWPMELTDQAMEEALTTLPRAIGLFDRGAIRLRSLPLRTLVVQDLPKLERPLTFVCRQQVSPATEAFVSFVRGQAGRRLLGQFGYSPPPEGGKR